MNRIVIAALGLVLPLSALAAGSENRPASQPAVVVQQVEPDSALRKLLDQIWARLRAIGPHQVTGSAAQGNAQVAGVRGAESTSSQLDPYWKGDRAADPAYRRELEAYGQAQALVEKGDAAGAARGFEDFVAAYPAGALKINARFALGAAYAAAGQKEKSLATLDAFLRDYPAHPLGGDARRLSELLRQP
jgi:TolA-binding protein